MHRQLLPSATGWAYHVRSSFAGATEEPCSFELRNSISWGKSFGWDQTTFLLSCSFHKKTRCKNGKPLCTPDSKITSFHTKSRTWLIMAEHWADEPRNKIPTSPRRIEPQSTITAPFLVVGLYSRPGGNTLLRSLCPTSK